MTSGDDWVGMSLLRLPSPTQRKFGYENENAGDVDRESFRQGRRPVREIKVAVGADENGSKLATRLRRSWTTWARREQPNAGLVEATTNCDMT